MIRDFVEESIELTITTTKAFVIGLVVEVSTRPISSFSS